MGFAADLARQVPNVERVSDEISGEVIPGKFKKGDIFVEVKEDLGVGRTGNVAVEISYKGEPSGIYAGSDRIVYKLGKHYWHAPTQRVIDYVESCAHRRCKGGDGWHSELVLIPYFQFTQLFDHLFSE